jgi:adenylate cyclase class IV
MMEYEVKARLTPENLLILKTRLWCLELVLKGKERGLYFDSVGRDLLKITSR